MLKPIGDTETSEEKPKTTSDSKTESSPKKTKKEKIKSKIKETKVADIPPVAQNGIQAPATEKRLKKLKSQPRKSIRVLEDLKLSFLDWIQYTEENQNIQPKESDKSEPLSDKLSIIDRFIEADPKIPPVGKTETIDSVLKKDFNSEELMTESLAKVLLKQKKYKKAISAYKILSLKYPEKNVFFAGQIQKIKKIATTIKYYGKLFDLHRLNHFCLFSTRFSSNGSKP